MTNPMLLIEIQGEKSILSLYKSPESGYLFEKVLYQRSKPGLESQLSPNDLNEFKEIIGLVTVTLQIPKSS